MISVKEALWEDGMFVEFENVGIVVVALSSTVVTGLNDYWLRAGYVGRLQAD